MWASFGTTDAHVQPFSWAEVLAVAGKLNRGAALETVSKISAALNRGGMTQKDFHAFLSEILLTQEANSRFRSQLHGNSFRPFIHCGLTRELTKLFWHYSGPSGYDLLDTDIREEICRLVLTVSQGVGANNWVDPHNATDNALLAGALLIARGAYYPSHDDGRLIDIKSAMLSDLIADTSIEKAFIDVHDVSPMEAMLAYLVVTAFFHQGTPEYFTHLNGLRFDTRLMFGMSNLSERVGRWFESRHVLSIDDLPDTSGLPGENDFFTDFGLFVERPYLRLANASIICLDHDYASSALSRGPFKLFNEVLRHDENPLYARIGPPFEQHVYTVLDHAFRHSKKKSVKAVPPKGGKNDLDGAAFTQDAAVLFECKSGVVTTSIRYGTDVEGLAKVLTDKFIEGRAGGEKRKKGFAQLADRVRSVIANPEQYGLTKRSVSTIIPTVVVEDDFVAQRLVAQWCTRKAKRLFEEFGSKVPCIAIIHATDLDHLAGLSDHITLPDALIRLSRTEYRGCFTVQQWIWEELRKPLNIDDEDLIQSVETETLLDKSMDGLAENFIELTRPKCPSCNTGLVLRQDKEEPDWICIACPKIGPIPSTDQELETYNKDVAAAIKRYHSLP
ncbi:MAG: hypothetical protein ABL962_06600 [Fimbriimonadaceae bacterium]